MPDSNLYLLTTDGCSLCSKAKTVLWPALSLFGLKLIEVDIIDYPPLLNAYAVKIPVICVTSPLEQVPAQTLDWPFEINQVNQWLIHQGCVEQSPPK